MLLSIGIAVRIAGDGEKYMHNKFCLIDVLVDESGFKENKHPVNGVLINGSMNWTANVSMNLEKLYSKIILGNLLRISTLISLSRVLIETGRIFTLHLMNISSLNIKRHSTIFGVDWLKLSSGKLIVFNSILNVTIMIYIKHYSDECYIFEENGYSVK